MRLVENSVHPSATEFHIECLTLRIILHYITYKIEDICYSSIISLHRKWIASHDLQTWLRVVGKAHTSRIVTRRVGRVLRLLISASYAMFSP